MARRAGTADLPLHGGHVPRWLADRMTRLGAVVSQAIVHHYGRDELLRRLASPFWFQSFGAVMGILFVGAGYASIYPLVVEKIGHRFPYYHPGFYNGIFSFAITGGFLAPWTLGYFTAAWGIQAVMIVPLFGTCMVFVLLLLIMLEAVRDRRSG